MACGQSQEIDNQTGSESTVADGTRHAGAALGNQAAIGGDAQDQGPAILPAFVLENGLDHQMGGTGARW